jgi:hypothetical protein
MLLLEGNQRHEDRRPRFTTSPTVFFEILKSRAIQQYKMGFLSIKVRNPT